MSTEVMLRSNAALDDKVEYCRLLAESGLLPANYRKQPANVLYAVEYGEMIGVPAMAAINGVHVIKGKPTASASLISALVRRAGHKLRVGFDSARQMGWAEIIRVDDPDFTYRSEWDLERAVTAELCVIRDGKPYAVDKDGDTLPWKKFFPSMTKARAITEVARDACEEVLFGLHYTPEELGAEVDDEGLPVVSVEQAAEKMRRSKGQPSEPDDWSTYPDTPPAPAEERASSQAQRKALVVLIERKRGVSGSDRGSQRTIAAAMLGHPVGSFTDLTAADASTLIDKLTAMPDHIADAEVIDEPAQPAPNPGNGDRPVPAVTAAALWAPTLDTLVTRAETQGGKPVVDQLRDLIGDAPTPEHINRVGQLAAEARDADHISPKDFGGLAAVVKARREALGLVGDEAPTAKQYEVRDRFAGRIRRATGDEFNELMGSLIESRDAGNITSIQYQALLRELDARYKALAGNGTQQSAGWSHQRLAEMTAAGGAR